MHITLDSSASTLHPSLERHKSIWRLLKLLSFISTVHSFFHHNFYVTDGNIMYLTDASRFLISCVFQHYAPVVGFWGGKEQVHNVDYEPVKLYSPSIE
jgi:hypothetical protein